MVLGALVAMRLRVRRLLLVGVVSCSAVRCCSLALAARPASRPCCCRRRSWPASLIEQFGVAWEVSIQEHIPADKLARVYSYDALGSLIAVPVGQIAAGPLADAIGPGSALLVAAGIVVLSVVGMLASGAVRTLEHTAAPCPIVPYAEPATSCACEPTIDAPAARCARNWSASGAAIECGA